MPEDRFRDVWNDDARMQAALDRAFHSAVRRHRAANVPMVMWENGAVVEVSPFDIPLPDDSPDDPPDPPKRRAVG
jgi:hypothetical protein